MSWLVNDPAFFVPEAVEGIVAACSRWVRPVVGGVVRRDPPAAGAVAVVVGGGSGHYPAFAGFVGPGMAHGAVLGQVFASPSADQVYAVAKACESGGGVLLCYGNYAGDVLNFNHAQARLRSEGIDCRTVVVTDDVMSADPDDRARRRGIAGDLVVIKLAGAASETMADLDHVERVAVRANERTRSVGVAFGGCTLPGARTRLFDVPAGQMAVGMGIHGEPGLSQVAMPTADGLAELLLSTLLDELPDDVPAARGGRVVPILNGLGTVKYEELFVVFREVARLLSTAGVETIDPEVGELVTSFDMAGVSLTLTWLDDELEVLWSASASSAGYSKGRLDRTAPTQSPTLAPASAPPPVPGVSVSTWVSSTDAAPFSAGSRESQALAVLVSRVLDAVELAVAEHADELGRLDAVAGDGDHGIGMARGTAAAAEVARDALEQRSGAGTVLTLAARAWANRAGGTSGALWGLGLRAAGEFIGDDLAPDPHEVVAALTSATMAVRLAGRAEQGDKTLLDALIPLRDAVTAELAMGEPPLRAWERGAVAARVAAEATAEMVPRIGRARPHGAASVGTPDPGAVSLALVARAAVAALQTASRQED